MSIEKRAGLLIPKIDDHVDPVNYFRVIFEMANLNVSGIERRGVSTKNRVVGYQYKLTVPTAREIVLLEGDLLPQPQSSADQHLPPEMLERYKVSVSPIDKIAEPNPILEVIQVYPSNGVRVKTSVRVNDVPLSRDNETTYHHNVRQALRGFEERVS